MPAMSRLLVQYIKDVTVVTFTESSIIDVQQIEQMRKDLYDMVDKQYKRRMILDMSKVKHLSSSALGVLLPLREKIKKLKGDLYLVGVTPDIRKIFKVTRLDKHFKFSDSEAAALTKMNVSLT